MAAGPARPTRTSRRSPRRGLWPARATQAQTAARRARRRSRSTRIVDAMAAAATPHAERSPAWPSRKPASASSPTRSRRTCSRSRRVYEFIRPMKTVGVDRAPRGHEGHRDRRAVRRRRGDRAVDQPDVDGHLQDAHRAQGALRHRHQPAPVGGALHHAARRGHGTKPRAGRAPEGAIGWMTTVTLEGTQELMKHRDVAVILATGGMGLVRAAYSAGKPAYGVGPGNAPVLHRAHRPTSPRPRATSSPARPSTTACSARRRTLSSSIEAVADDVQAAVQAQGGYFLSPARSRRAGAGAGHAAAAAESDARRQVGDVHIAAQVGHHRARRHARAASRELRASAATIRSRSRSSARCSPTTSWRTGAKAASAASRSCATAAWATPCRSTRTNDAGHPRVRPEEAGVPHLREHADHARLDRPDDRARPGDDARLRRLRRQHHVRQHLAAPPAEHQAARLRAAAARHGRPGGRSEDAPAAGVAPAAPSGANRAASRRCPRRPACRRGAGDAGQRDASSLPERRAARRRQRRRRRPRRRGPRTDRAEFVCEDDVRSRDRAGAQDSSSATKTIVTPAARDLARRSGVIRLDRRRGAITRTSAWSCSS